MIADPPCSSTVDSVEASKFILTASEWWDTAGAQQPLHAMNTIRVPLVKRALLGGGAEIRKNHTHPLEGLTVLDVGCGGGILSEVCRVSCVTQLIVHSQGWILQ